MFALTTSPINASYQKRDFLLCILLICISGNPLFMDRYYFPLTLFLLLIFLSFNKKKLISSNNWKRILKWVFLFILIFIGQGMTIDTYSMLGNINFIIKLLIGAIIYLIIGENFRYIYFRVIYYLALISLIFFTFVEIFGFVPTLFTLSDGIYRSIIFYGHQINYNEIIHRNSGMFWEPGAFATHICFGILLNIDRIGEIWNNEKFKFIILIIALLTTFSTTGYLVIMVIIAYHLIFKLKKRFLIIFILPALIAGYFAIINMEFMGEKIKGQYENAKEYDASSNIVLPDRFSAALLDWYYISKNPFFGNGLMQKNMYKEHMQSSNDWALSGMGNGFTSGINSMGIVFFIIYFIFLFKQLHLSKMDSFFFILILIALMWGEMSIQSPLIIGLIFISQNLINQKQQVIIST